MTLLGPHNMEKVCVSDFLYLGFLDGERALSLVRLVCMVVSLSVVSSWYSRPKIGNMLLFFVHWLSGVTHVLAGWILEDVVLLCALKTQFLAFIRVLKFIELLGSNMLEVTNVAICVNLALIVHGQRRVSRVRNVSSPKMILCLLCVSTVGAAIAVPAWDFLLVGGTFVSFEGSTPERSRWVMISYLVFEAVASLVMTAVTATLLIFRRPELGQAWRLDRRIQMHFALTAIALSVDIGITCAGLDHLLSDEGTEDVGVIMATWKMRYLHVALDALVLHRSLATPSFNLENEAPSSCDSHAEEFTVRSTPHLMHEERDFVMLMRTVHPATRHDVQPSQNMRVSKL